MPPYAKPFVHQQGCEAYCFFVVLLYSFMCLLDAGAPRSSYIKESTAGILFLCSHAKRASPEPVVLLSRAYLCVSQRLNFWA